MIERYTEECFDLWSGY